MVKAVLIVNNETELVERVSEIVDTMGEPGIVFLKGEMGSGKTTLVKYICLYLGIQEPVSSPTFSISNIYRDGKGRQIYHLDLYRLESEEEFVEAGLTEVMEHDYWVFVEWPELALPFLDQSPHILELEVESSGTRKITIL